MMQLSTDVTIESLIEQAVSEWNIERRRGRRVPYFGPVKITNESGEIVEGFSRDIATSGIGLLHEGYVESGIHTVTLEMGKDKQVDVLVDIGRCDLLFDNVYVSGGTFCHMPTTTAARVFLDVLSKELERRGTSRYPFYRPAICTSTVSTDPSETILTRDISPSGIGFLHWRELPSKRILLEVLVSEDDCATTTIDIKWSRKCANGLYLSGGTFHRVMAEELPDLVS